jgi:hypothetical protein
VLHEPGAFTGEPNDHNAYVPTLSELIEACEERFWKLTKRLNATGWVAIAKAPNGGNANGSSPEEAVARLWLALNKK